MPENPLESYSDMDGSIRWCSDCLRPRIHFAAPQGFPTCAFCGAPNPTPEEIAVAQQHAEEPEA